MADREAIKDLEDYNIDEHKLQASVGWVLQKAFGSSIPSTYLSIFYENEEKQVLPTPTLINGLCTGELYCKAASNILEVGPVGSHGQVQQALQKYGVQLDETVNDTTLSQTAPVKIAAHMALMDALMMTWFRKVFTVERAVQIVGTDWEIQRHHFGEKGKFGGPDEHSVRIRTDGAEQTGRYNVITSARKENLADQTNIRKYVPVHANERPRDAEDAVCFWINKICAAVRDSLEQAGIDSIVIPEMEDLYEEIWDLCCLSVLIHFYRPKVVKLEDFKQPTKPSTTAAKNKNFSQINAIPDLRGPDRAKTRSHLANGNLSNISSSMMNSVDSLATHRSVDSLRYPYVRTMSMDAEAARQQKAAAAMRQAPTTNFADFGTLGNRTAMTTPSQVAKIPQAMSNSTDALSKSPVTSHVPLASIKMQLEEKRRQYEAKKFQALADTSVKRQEIGKEAFFQALGTKAPSPVDQKMGSRAQMASMTQSLHASLPRTASPAAPYATGQMQQSDIIDGRGRYLSQDGVAELNKTVETLRMEINRLSVEQNKLSHYMTTEQQQAAQQQNMAVSIPQDVMGAFPPQTPKGMDFTKGLLVQANQMPNGSPPYRLVGYSNKSPPFRLHDDTLATMGTPGGMQAQGLTRSSTMPKGTAKPRGAPRDPHIDFGHITSFGEASAMSRPGQGMNFAHPPFLPQDSVEPLSQGGARIDEQFQPIFQPDDQFDFPGNMIMQQQHQQQMPRNFQHPSQSPAPVQDRYHQYRQSQDPLQTVDPRRTTGSRSTDRTPPPVPSHANVLPFPAASPSPAGPGTSAFGHQPVHDSRYLTYDKYTGAPLPPAMDTMGNVLHPQQQLLQTQPPRSPGLPTPNIAPAPNMHADEELASPTSVGLEANLRGTGKSGMAIDVSFNDPSTPQRPRGQPPARFTQQQQVIPPQKPTQPHSTAQAQQPLKPVVAPEIPPKPATAVAQSTPPLGREASPGSGFVVGSSLADSKDVEMQRRKEQLLANTMRRREQVEVARQKAEAESAKRKAEQERKQEEAERKKAEKEEKRQRLLDEYMKKKERESEQADGVGGGPPPSSAFAAPGSSARNTKSTPRGGSQPPRPKSQVVQKAAKNITPPNLSASSSVDRLNDAGDNASSSDGVAEPALKLFVKPTSKSNRPIIYNALQYSCLAGAVNDDTKRKTFEELAKSDAKHFLVLFRDQKCQFRGLYSWDQVSDTAHRLHGVGPKACSEVMMHLMFKYDSGGKHFTQIPAKHLSATIDGFTIHDHCWQKKKPAIGRRA